MMTLALCVAVLWAGFVFAMALWLHKQDPRWGRTVRDLPAVALVALLMALSVVTAGVVVFEFARLLQGGA